MDLLALSHARSNVEVSSPAPWLPLERLKPAQETYSCEINPIFSSDDPWSLHWDSSWGPESPIWMGGEKGFSLGFSLKHL